MIEPRRPIIVRDEDCMPCSTSMSFVLRNDRQRLFRPVAAQSQMGRAAYRELEFDPDDPATMIVIARGRAYSETTTALHVPAELGWPWQVAVLGYALPSEIRDRVYRVVARNRYRRFGRRRSCPLSATLGDEASR